MVEQIELISVKFLKQCPSTQYVNDHNCPHIHSVSTQYVLNDHNCPHLHCHPHHNHHYLYLLHDGPGTIRDLGYPQISLGLG